MPEWNNLIKSFPWGLRGLFWQAFTSLGMLAVCRGEWCRDKEATEQLGAALVQCKAPNRDCWEPARICRLQHSRLWPKTGSGSPLNLSWAQCGLEVCHCGRHPRTDHTRAGTPAKTLQPWWPCCSWDTPKQRAAEENQQGADNCKQKTPKAHGVTDKYHHAHNHKPPVPCRQSWDKVSTTCGENRGIWGGGIRSAPSVCVLSFFFFLVSVPEWMIRSLWSIY